MSTPGRGNPFFIACLGAACLGLGAGCSSMHFSRSHRVEVDALTGQPGAGGTSYQLIAKDPGVTRDALLHTRAVACVKAALAQKGMFEAPPKTPPDLFITVDYGIGNSIPSMSGPPALEKYLHLSARRRLEDALAVKGEELWNVRVTIAEPNTTIEGVFPLLAVVAADYIGLDTQSEKVISIDEKSPAILQVIDEANHPAEKP